jgi:DNA-binding transcriptional ArsR family regulator
MNQRQIFTLRLVAQFPRTAFQINAISGVASNVAEVDLAVLAEAGYVIEPLRKDGRWEITAPGRHYLAQLPQITPSTLICNASMPSGSLRPTTSYQRNDGLKHVKSLVTHGYCE